MTFLIFVVALIFAELLLALWLRPATSCSNRSPVSAPGRKPIRPGGPQILPDLFSFVLLTTSFF